MHSHCHRSTHNANWCDDCCDEPCPCDRQWCVWDQWSHWSLEAEHDESMHGCIVCATVVKTQLHVHVALHVMHVGHIATHHVIRDVTTHTTVITHIIRTVGCRQLAPLLIGDFLHLTRTIGIVLNAIVLTMEDSMTARALIVVTFVGCVRAEQVSLQVMWLCERLGAVWCVRARCAEVLMRGARVSLQAAELGVHAMVSALGALVGHESGTSHGVCAYVYM